MMTTRELARQHVNEHGWDDVYGWLDVAAQAWLNRRTPVTPIPSSPTGLSAYDLADEFLSAGEEREIQVFDDMETMFNHLEPLFPLRVARMRHEIRWLRHQAYFYGMLWGKADNGPEKQSPRRACLGWLEVQLDGLRRRIR